MWIRVYSNRSDLDLSAETIRIQNFYFSRKLWWKNCWKWPKWFRCHKAHSFQTINDVDSKSDSTNWRLEWRLCQIFTSLFILYCQRNRPRQSVTVWPGWFNVLNHSATPKMIIKIYFNLFQFLLKVLELFECLRGDPYMIANRNFVRFTHS